MLKRLKGNTNTRQGDTAEESLGSSKVHVLLHPKSQYASNPTKTPNDSPDRVEFNLNPVMTPNNRAQNRYELRKTS